MTKGTQPGRLRAALHGGASIMALWAAPALAQDANVQDGTETETAEPATPIVVTGSRLRTDGSQTPIPVTVVGAEALDAMGAGGLIEGISQLPQFFGNQSVAAVQSSGVSGHGFFNRGGYGNLDLRGLGPNRTLTLLNGHRVISSGPFGGVDINTFPDAMVQSVETVTGGASAAYGTDAVAGVVNFLLDKKFTGFRASLQGGVSDRGDNGNYEASAAYGTKIGDRGHFLISGEIGSQDGVHSFRDRDWYQAWGIINGRAYPNVVSANASFSGVIRSAGTSIDGMEFTRDGAAITPFIRGAVGSGATGTPPAVHSITDGGSGDYISSDPYTLFPDASRNSIYAYADYEVADGVTVFAQYMRGQNRTFRYNDPTGSFSGTPTAATIFADNAFLPQSLRDTMAANNIASFQLRKMGSFADLAEHAWLRDDNVMNSFSGGLTWDISSDGFMGGWQADLYYQYGTNKRKAWQSGLRVDRIFAALDAVDEGEYTTGVANGNVVCRVSMFGDAFPGCQPINLFGQGNASAAAIDWVTGYEAGETITTPIYYADSGFDRGDSMTFTSGQAKLNTTRMRQHVAEFSMNGDLAQGWAGPISLAFGGSFRRESILQLVEDPANPSSNHATGHPVLCNGEAPGLRGVSQADCVNTVGTQYSKVSNIKGAINVYEAFAETLIPLLADTGPVNAANLHLAGRWANYSGSGTVWAYKAGLDVELFDFLRLRGTYSRDVRAANLSERFDRTGGAATLDDPRTTVVEAINVTTVSGGNPNVLPEKADTLTAGMVIRPAGLPGLSVSLDYFDIKVKGAIDRLGPQAVLNGCLAGNDPELCSMVTFNADDVPIIVADTYINVNQNRVRGLDLEANYDTRLSLFGPDERLALRGFASWLFENSETFSNGTMIDRAGQTGMQTDGTPYGLPDFKATANATYSVGNFSAFLQGRYISPGTQENNPPIANFEANHVDSAFYLDLRLTQKFDIGNAGSLEAFFAVTNLTDTDPPRTPYYSAFAAHAIQTNSVLFDLLGRRYTTGLRLAF